MSTHDSDQLSPDETQVADSQLDAAKPYPVERMPEIVYLLGIAGVMFAISGTFYKVMSIYAQTLHPADDLAGHALWWLTIVGVGVSVGLFIHAIMLLLRLEWGRVGMMIYAVLALLLTFPGAWVRIARSGDWLAIQRAQSDEVPAWAGGAGTVIHIVFAFVALLYPLALLYHLTRPRVRRAFRDAKMK